MSLILAHEWIKAALLDLKSIRYLVDDEYLSPIIAFHSQQTIEKCFKALLMSKNINFKKIHSLEKLLSLCDNAVVINNYDLIDLLDSLYTESRYPNDIGLLPYGKPTLKDAQEFYKFAQDIFNQVCIILNIDLEEIKK